MDFLAELKGLDFFIGKFLELGEKHIEFISKLVIVLTEIITSPVHSYNIPGANIHLVKNSVYAFKGGIAQ